MNRKKILIPLLVMLMLFAVSPALAAPTAGQKVPVVQISGDATTGILDDISYPYTGTQRLAPDNDVSHRYDYGIVYKTTLIIDGGTPLEGLSFNNYDRMINFAEYPVPGMILYHYDVVWVYGDGGFKGNINMLVTEYNAGPPPTYNVKFNFELKGFGSFEGSTIQFKYDGPNAQPWTGYLLKP
jgi:hypothetical protein